MLSRVSRAWSRRYEPNAEFTELVYFLYLMRFEFDLEKSDANKAKHGIDFVEAQAIWIDTDRLEIPARSLDEPRYPSDRAHCRQKVVSFCHLPQ
jgi:hypothetical protein